MVEKNVFEVAQHFSQMRKHPIGLTGLYACPTAESLQLATACSDKVLVTDANKQSLTSLQQGKFQLLQLQRKP